VNCGSLLYRSGVKWRWFERSGALEILREWRNFSLVATVCGEDFSEVGRERGSGEEIGSMYFKAGYLSE
jgi:hypothetical protein